jgi:hypothetical protein
LQATDLCHNNLAASAGRFWPTAAINVSEFHAQTMAAFWPGPEPASLDGALAAVDPFRNWSAHTLRVGR